MDHIRHAPNYMFSRANTPRASSASSISRLRGSGVAGFTLVELLTVTAIVAILGGLLVPALPRAKEHARMARCLSNLHQIGVVFREYMGDNETRYPTETGPNWMSFRLGGGDPKPQAAARFGLEWATNRVLWPYTHNRELYRCPADRGANLVPWMLPFSSYYDTVGTSYKYNEGPWIPFTLVAQKDPHFGLTGKKENWVSNPARYVLIHEPPATPYWDGGWLYFFSHYACGPGTRFSLSEVSDRFISPALFADGHAASHDFTRAIRSRPGYPSEPTPEWYFYEPACGTP